MSAMYTPAEQIEYLLPCRSLSLHRTLGRYLAARSLGRYRQHVELELRRRQDGTDGLAVYITAPKVLSCHAQRRLRSQLPGLASTLQRTAVAAEWRFAVVPAEEVEVSGGCCARPLGATTSPIREDSHYVSRD